MLTLNDREAALFTSENTCPQSRLARFTAMADKVDASRQRYDTKRESLTDSAAIEATYVEQIVEQDRLAAIIVAICGQVCRFRNCRWKRRWATVPSIVAVRQLETIVTMQIA